MNVLAASETGSPIAIQLLPLVTTLVVFGVAFWILKSKVWPRITDGLDDRDRKIREEIRAAEEAREQAGAALKEYEASLATARQEAAEMIAKAKSTAKAAGEELRQCNEADLQEMKQRAARDIDAARQTAINELHAEASNLAAAIAGKILRREITADDQRRLVEESLEELSAEVVGGVDEGTAGDFFRVPRKERLVMARNDALARIYARSLFELAAEAGGPDKIVEVAGELEQLCELARGDRAFAEFLASPLINRGRRAAALRAILSDRITDLTLRFVLVVNDKGRLAHLEAMTAAYDHLVQEAHDRIEVDVFTAAPIDEAQLAAVADRVRSVLGKEPVLHRYTDASMIGGLTLRIGDRLLDGSVATQLRRLRRNLLTTGGAAVRACTDRILEEGGGA